LSGGGLLAAGVGPALLVTQLVSTGLFASTGSCAEARNQLYSRLAPEELSRAQEQSLERLAAHERPNR